MSTAEERIDDSIEKLGVCVAEAAAQLEFCAAQQAQIIAHQRSETTQALEHLKALEAQGKTILQGYSQLMKSIEEIALRRMDESAKAAGMAQAQAFGDKVLQSLLPQITRTSQQILEGTSALQGILSSLRWRVIGLFAGALLALGCTVALFLWGCWLDTASTLRAQEALQSQESPAVTTLQQQGKQLILQECPGDPRQRMCVRVDPDAHRFGPRQEFAVID